MVCGGYYKDSKGATIANTLIHERCHPASTWKQKDFPEPDKTHPPVEAIKTRICNRPNQNAIIEAPLWVIDVSMFAIPGHTPASTKSTDLRQSLGTALTGIT